MGFGMLMVPVPNLICLVAAASQAMKAIQDVMFFGPVGDVLADIGLAEPEFVGQQEGFAILLEG
jgi:hypothetical protein